MPKQKTHSGAKKRVRLTGSGKVRRGKAGKSHMMIGKNKRRAPRLPAPRISLGADGPAKDVPELAVLSPFVGRWDLDITFPPVREGEDGGKQKMKEEIRWQLGGRFLVGEGYTEDGKLSSVWLWTYDPKTKTYPMTMFQDTGNVPIWFTSSAFGNAMLIISASGVSGTVRRPPRFRPGDELPESVTQ